MSLNLATTSLTTKEPTKFVGSCAYIKVLLITKKIKSDTFLFIA